MTSDPAKCDPSLPGGEDVFKQGVEVLKGPGRGRLRRSRAALQSESRRIRLLGGVNEIADLRPMVMAVASASRMVLRGVSLAPYSNNETFSLQGSKEKIQKPN